MIVSHDQTADFQSIQAAIDSIPTNCSVLTKIYIKPGIYKEKLYINKPYVMLIGEDAENTLITYDDYAEKHFPDESTYGTFNSYTAFIGGDDFSAINLTFENSSGPGHLVGQAIAAYVDADRACFKNCRFLGHQDTLFTGPLPPAPIIPGSFKGPRENAPRLNGRQYYENCFIQGDIDFIFGSATAFFYGCEIFTNNRQEAVNGFVTAPSTAEGQAYGYVFENCKLTSDCEAETVYLGRPWRHFAKSVFISCDLGAHIKREGWHDWNKTDSHETCFFAEAQNTGSGSSITSRAPWSHQLSAESLTHYSKEAVLSGSDLWQPWKITFL